MIAMIAPVAFLSGLIFKVVFVATWKASCGKVSDCFKRHKNRQLVAKCEQMICMTTGEFGEQAAKPKFQCCSKQQQVESFLAHSLYISTTFNHQFVMTNLKLHLLLPSI